MPWDILHSQPVIDTLLMLMLLAWLGTSALMTLFAGFAAQRHEARQQRLQQRSAAAHSASSTASATQSPALPT